MKPVIISLDRDIALNLMSLSAIDDTDYDNEYLLHGVINHMLYSLLDEDVMSTLEMYESVLDSLGLLSEEDEAGNSTVFDIGVNAISAFHARYHGTDSLYVDVIATIYPYREELIWDFPHVVVDRNFRTVAIW